MDADGGRAPVIDWQAARRNIPGGAVLPGFALPVAEVFA